MLPSSQVPLQIILTRNHVEIPDPCTSIDPALFIANTKWLNLPTPKRDGTFMTITEAFKKAFEYPIQVIEQNIQDAIAEQERQGSLDPLIDQATRCAVVARKEEILLEWYIQLKFP
jgi:hypothetical protein